MSKSRLEPCGHSRSELTEGYQITKENMMTSYDGFRHIRHFRTVLFSTDVGKENVERRNVIKQNLWFNSKKTALNGSIRTDGSTSDTLPKKNGPKLYGSSEGRFSIIDEFAKDSSESDVDSPLPTYTTYTNVNQRLVRSSFSQSVDSRCLQSKATASTTPSRFRIVPLESKYKRGRWNCFDYYDKDTVSKPPKARAPDTAATRQTSSSQRSNRPARKVTDERLQRGLESSLAPHKTRSRINSTTKRDLLTSAVGSNNGMGQPSTSAIDSKIEQAMDLVKTHLMFAVREELDVLRGKITELESHIIRLETENAVFKANIPSDVLRNLSLDQAN
ncbi:TSC-22/dip/bun family protein [Teladorsagia circumcincta]|uniref:TSC-22/dip/bun family protein n=1 Tax=Teladorsagia circumcincta TaxID=45464 RepID=A0A2G9UZ36_TELCI|nr:TSC-22/dip/bun family protein [Teladorsagia circumcincta]